MKIPTTSIRCSAKRGCYSSILVILALALAPALAVAPLRAQETTVHPPARTSHRYRAPSLDDRVQALSKSLDLSEAQRSAVKNILEHRQHEIREAQRSAATDGGALVDRIRAVEDKTVERIRATLNEEQRKKYEPLGARASASIGQQKSVEDWLKEIGQR